jgi:hypothetical protein
MDSSRVRVVEHERPYREALVSRLRRAFGGRRKKRALSPGATSIRLQLRGPMCRSARCNLVPLQGIV